MSLANAIATALSQDDLSTALDTVKTHLKTTPADAQARYFYIDLLMLIGDYERADHQCGVAVKFAPADTMGFAFLRNQLRGMAARHAWFETNAVPQFPNGPAPLDQAALDLNLAHREGDARASLAAFEEQRGTQPMAWNGETIDDLRDLDDRTAQALEVITSGGAYLWIAFSRIASLTLEPIARPRDFAFRRATLSTHDGSSADILVPMIYHGTDTSDRLLLGRETQWVNERSGLVTGRGQRSFLAGERVVSFHDLTLLESVPEASESEVADG